jgi:plastocyanin
LVQTPERKIMPRRLLLLLAALAIVLVSASAAGATTMGTLKGEVYGNSAFKIEMKGPNGKAIKTLKAGTYTVKVQDIGTIHDFHLSGPGVNKATSIGGTGTQTWTVKLKPGTYTFKCDPHSPQMHGSFKVTA